MKREGSGDRFVPGEALLLPTVLAAMVLTAVNDHWLKSVAPGWLTGKLSDFTGLYFFPFLVVALIELASEILDRARRGARTDRRRGPTSRSFFVLLFLEAAAFTALKTSPALALRLEDAWIAVLGIQARFTPDSTDLCALLVLPLAWRTARSGGLLHDTPMIGAVERDQNRRSARKVVLLPLGLFLGGCTSFKIPGYEGRHVDYVALQPETEVSGSSERRLPSPRLVRSDEVLIVFYPFRIAWLPRVDWLTPGRHEQSLEGWVWIENGSSAEIRVFAPRLRTPAPRPIESSVAIARGGSRDESGPWSYRSDRPSLGEYEVPPGEGVWVEARIEFGRDFAERFELQFDWQETGQEHSIPVAYARVGP